MSYVWYHWPFLDFELKFCILPNQLNNPIQITRTHTHTQTIPKPVLKVQRAEQNMGVSTKAIAARGCAVLRCHDQVEASVKEMVANV